MNHVARFRPFSWTPQTIRAINRAGWLAVVVTNQAGVARGYFSASMIDAVHAKLRRAVEPGGARLDAIYFCPHHPSVGESPWRQDCDCRKPRPGMLHRAESELGADLARSWVVGDRIGDCELAWAAGARGALVRTGYGRGEMEHASEGWSRSPDLVAANCLEAVDRILAGEAT